MRSLWNWLRYRRWTACSHTIQATMLVRQAVWIGGRDASPSRGEAWTICHQCGAVLQREPKEEN
jgi:hypothetical protein